MPQPETSGHDPVSSIWRASAGPEHSLNARSNVSRRYSGLAFRSMACNATADMIGPFATGEDGKAQQASLLNAAQPSGVRRGRGRDASAGETPAHRGSFEAIGSRTGKATRAFGKAVFAAIVAGAIGNAVAAKYLPQCHRGISLGKTPRMNTGGTSRSLGRCRRLRIAWTVDLKRMRLTRCRGT
jgi:hypothetical protein